MPLSAITGLGGALYSGSRVVTRFEKAVAEPLGGYRWRLVAESHRPDPYWWEHRDPDRELKCHTRFGWLPARYVADEPLTLEVFIDPEESV